MSYPTANLVARYEPKDWGYSDGDVINNTTKKFLDGTANVNDLTTVTGSPTYKTNILNGRAVVRFSGSTQAVAGLFATGHNPGTVAGVFIPRALPGGNASLWSYNNNGSTNGPLVYYDGSHLVGYFNGTGTTSNTYTPVIGTAVLLWLDYKTASGGGLHLRADRAAVGSTTSLPTDYTPTRFSIAFNGFSAYYQLDCAALFIYSAVQAGSDQTDLEDYLYNVYMTAVSGSGADTLGKTSAGTAREIFLGTGADTLAKISSGTAREIFLGTGADLLIPLSAGAGGTGFFGTGADILALLAAGTGLVFPGVAGSGADLLHPLSAGIAREIFRGSGADSLFTTSTGAGRETFVGSGADFLNLLSAGGNIGVVHGAGQTFLAISSTGRVRIIEVFGGGGVSGRVFDSLGIGSSVFGSGGRSGNVFGPGR